MIGEGGDGRRRSRGGAHYAWHRIVLWGPVRKVQQELHSICPVWTGFMIACGQDHFRMESWPLGFGKGLFCYDAAEYEWVIGRRGCCGTWWTFLGEGGE